VRLRKARVSAARSRLEKGPSGPYPRTAFSVFARKGGRGERKVRTPQSSVPDNVREGEFKFTRRKVPQKTYRPSLPARVRVKRCGKSAPPRQ